MDFFDVSVPFKSYLKIITYSKVLNKPKVLFCSVADG